MEIENRQPANQHWNIETETSEKSRVEHEEVLVMATKTSWSDERLRRLFVRYRERYWPGKLRGYKVAIAARGGAFGECETSRRLLSIDVERHQSDRDIRSTLLHEMAHAAAGYASKGHGSRFFAQLEYLLMKGAPVTLGFPETGGRALLESVPPRFVRCRRALEPVYRRRQAELERLSQQQEGPEIEIDLAYLSQRVEEIAFEYGARLGSVIRALGDEYCLTDVDHKPLPEFEAMLPALRRAHRRGLRERRADRVTRERFFSSERTVAGS